MKGTDATVPADRPLLQLDQATRLGGLVTVPVGPGGKWAALRDLRQAMADVRRRSGDPALSFIFALARDGRVVSGRDPEAALFVLGYHVRQPH